VLRSGRVIVPQRDAAQPPRLECEPVGYVIAVAAELVQVGRLVHEDYNVGKVFEDLGAAVVLGAEDESVFKLLQDGVL